MAAVALLVVALGAGCSKPADTKKPGAGGRQPIAVAVAPVEQIPLDRTLAVVGTLLPRDEATIAAQVEGQIETTWVDFGDRVEAGQKLASIDTASYEAFARQAVANVARAQANLEQAERSLRRVQELQASRISSASEMDLATADAAKARAELKAVEAAAAVADLNLKRSQAVAPFPGSIAERLVNAGDFVKVGAPLFRMVNDRELRFMVQAPERYSGQVEIGQTARFTVDAFPGRTFAGKVYLVSPSVNTATRSFSLAALVPNAAGELKANTFARGELLLASNVPTLVVPLEAVVSFAGVTKAFVIERGVAHGRDVKVGRVHQGKQEIIEGLKPGEQVAVTGQTKLYENAAVRLLDPVAASSQ